MNLDDIYYTKLGGRAFDVHYGEQLLGTIVMVYGHTWMANNCYGTALGGYDTKEDAARRLARDWLETRRYLLQDRKVS